MTETITNHVNLLQKQWLKAQQAWIGTWKPILTLMLLENSDVSLEAQTRDLALQSRLGAPLASGSSWLHFSAIFGALVLWPRGRLAQGPWCGCLLCSLACNRLTTWAKSIQTTAPHSLDHIYSTSEKFFFHAKFGTSVFPPTDGVAWIFPHLIWTS